VTVEDVRRELARVYREAKSGRRDVSDSSKLAHILSVLARLIESSDLERRIQELEAAQQAPGASQSLGVSPCQAKH
jgi:uncharacterized Zn finger protein (UPF0148 family)